jgi:hypothetical protein
MCNPAQGAPAEWPYAEDMTHITQPAMIPGAREPGRPVLAPAVTGAFTASLTADTSRAPVPSTGGALSRLMLTMIERLISLLRTKPVL